MLDDLKRALRMESPTPRLSETNLRKLSRGFRSSKKSRLSVTSDVESSSVQDGLLNGRSVSLSTLLPSGGPSHTRRPHGVDKLQTVEAKMAGIEVSLGWRKRREVLLETLPRAAKELVKELDTLHNTLRDKDTTIQSLRTQITNLGGSVKIELLPGGVPKSPGSDVEGMDGGHTSNLDFPEKRRVQDKINKVLMEIESKKVAVKNLKITLDKIDMTDNIDVRIRAAEMEYELEREELNILNLREEVGVLQSRLQETISFSPSSHAPEPLDNNGNISFNTNYQTLGNISAASTSRPAPAVVVTDVAAHGNLSTIGTRLPLSFHTMLSSGDNHGANTTLLSLTVQNILGKTPFHVTSRTQHTGIVIDWATDDTTLKRGDKLVEVDGCIVLGLLLEQVMPLLNRSGLLELVVLRILQGSSVSSIGVIGAPHTRRLERALDDRSRELRELQTELDRALREKEDVKSDKTRLSHRISYLEDQVTELETSFKKSKHCSTGFISSSSDSSSSPAPSSPGATVIQVYQKGQQTMAVARPRADTTGLTERTRKYPTLLHNKCRGTLSSSVTSPPRRTSSSSSSHNPSCASSSSGYASYTSFRSSTSQSNHHRNNHYETIEAIRSSARPNSSTEHRRPRRLLSPRPDSRNEVNSRPSSRNKPTPPKKPERLSLQRATSLLSVDQVVSSSRSTRRADGGSDDDHLNSSHVWKSTGNGLNSDQLDSISTYSFPASNSGNFIKSKFRSEFVPRRESSPLPVQINSSRRNLRLYETPSAKLNFPDDERIHGSRVNLSVMDGSVTKENFEYCVDKTTNEYPIPCSWSPVVNRDSSSPYLTTSSSSYHTPSSGGSPCGSSSGKAVSVHDISSLDENTNTDDNQSFIASPIDANDNSNSSITPTNTPKSSPLKNTQLFAVNNLKSTGVKKTENTLVSDINLVHAEPMYGYLPLKQTNHSGGINKMNHSHISLSSMHNIQKNYNNAIRYIQPKNESFTSMDSKVALTQNNEKFSSSTAKENNPVNSYIYGNSFTPKYQAFCSLKRHSGKYINPSSTGSHAPSTPITPRSNSALKVRTSKYGEEWC